MGPRKLGLRTGGYRAHRKRAPRSLACIHTHTSARPHSHTRVHAHPRRGGTCRERRGVGRTTYRGRTLARGSRCGSGLPCRALARHSPNRSGQESSSSTRHPPSDLVRAPGLDTPAERAVRGPHLFNGRKEKGALGLGRRWRAGWGGGGGHYLFKDAVMSYLDVRRRVRDCLKHPGLVRNGQEGPRTNLCGRNLSHWRVAQGESLGV